MNTKDIFVIQPTKNLSDAILLRINKEKKHLAKIRLIFTSSVEFISFIAFIPILKYFITEFSQSGFYQYLSLIFSDGSIILTYWKELSLSLIESLPILSITAILTLIFILIITSKFIIQDSKIIFNRTQLA